MAVRVNDAPATFLLDTGAEYSVVSTRLLAALHLVTDHQGSRDFADDVEIGVGPIGLRHERVMVMPFDAYYARGRHIDGLLGHDLFARYVVEIEFRRHRLTFWEPSAYKPPARAVIVPIEFAGRLPVIASTLTLRDGRSLASRLMVDTGASQAVILRYPFAHEHDLFALAADAATTTRAPSLANGQIKLADVPVERIGLARWTFTDVRVQAYSEPIGSGAATASDGLIGNAILARLAMAVDYPHQRILLRDQH